MAILSVTIKLEKNKIKAFIRYHILKKKEIGLDIGLTVEEMPFSVLIILFLANTIVETTFTLAMFKEICGLNCA